MTQFATLAAVETFDRQRIAIVRCKDGERGWTEMRAERQQRDGSWVAAGAKIIIPNQAVFLVRDAFDRSCQLAGGDRR